MRTSEEIVVIKPPRRWPRPDLKALWRHRDLAYFLSWRDVKIRYKQTLVGFGWAVFQPLISMVVFTIVFNRVTTIPSEGIPYPVFVLAGLVPWTYFANAVAWSSHSLVSNIPLVTKVYFPRILLPVSGIVTWAFDLGVYLVLLFATMGAYGIMPRPTALLVPLLFLFVGVTALSIGLWTSALNVRYRDVGYAMPFMISLWLFVTPVIYPGTQVPEGLLRFVYSLNPMTGVVEAFRWALLGTSPPGTFVGPSLLAVLALLVSGWIYFLRTEQSFADVI